MIVCLAAGSSERRVGETANRFLLRFSGAVLVLFGLLFVLGEGGAAPVAEVIARLVAAGLEAFGIETERSGTILAIGGFRGVVVGQCTGLFEAALLVGAIWAWPALAKERLRGILLGTAVLFGVNVLRVASLMLIGAHAPGWFTEAHLYVWQGILVAVVGGTWLAWAGRVRPVA